MLIDVLFSSNRLNAGQLSVKDTTGSVVFGPVPCLGKADNTAATVQGNSTRDPTLSFGDTPTGDYRVTEFVKHTSGETTSITYGVSPSLLLDPQDGQALVAKNNGRNGLMIHGGAPSATGGLRPTHGCIRLSETSQRDLVALTAGIAIASLSVSVRETPIV
jgi:lipoprotein-anchoring transpeptidase ErfK/SrfK